MRNEDREKQRVGERGEEDREGERQGTNKRRMMRKEGKERDRQIYMSTYQALQDGKGNMKRERERRQKKGHTYMANGRPSHPSAPCAWPWPNIDPAFSPRCCQSNPVELMLSATFCIFGCRWGGSMQTSIVGSSADVLPRSRLVLNGKDSL